MTIEEVIRELKIQFVGEYDRQRKAKDMAIKILEQEHCDCISRQTVKEQMIKYGFSAPDMTVTEFVEDLPPVTQEPKTGHCKECKYFEYDSVAKVDGIPLIVAHEICSRWGDGCKTSEDGYCFLFEPQAERSDKE